MTFSPVFDEICRERCRIHAIRLNAVKTNGYV
jgi:hypothetical protein